MTTESQRFAASPQWHDGKFRNPQPLWNDLLGGLGSLFRADPNAAPGTPVPVYTPSAPELLDPAGGLKATWLGHSTVFLDLEGTRILTDPVWSERASPLAWLGPKRFFPPPIALEALPEPQVVTLSHDHYDHLDLPALGRMRNWETRFVVPLGLGARLREAGIRPDRITELDWWQRTRIGGLEIVCTPARHASGRGLLDKDRTLWSGFAFLGASHRVYFSGDTGLFPGLRDIGGLGPFDLTLIECGEYGQAWPDWHLGPEQAVEAHRRVGGKALLPIHWGTFKLAPHCWVEPVERVLVAAEIAGIRVLTPRPGEPVEPGANATQVRWWPSLPWKRAWEAPIQATLDGRKPGLLPEGVL
jgi:L-ascorbate metabolism protein UlaG (beta-lactamase superfamily)